MIVCVQDPYSMTELMKKGHLSPQAYTILRRANIFIQNRR